MITKPINHELCDGLPAYEVTYADGTSYITSMAKGITLAEARAYFVGQSFEQFNGMMLRVISVESVN